MLFVYKIITILISFAVFVAADTKWPCGKPDGLNMAARGAGNKYFGTATNSYNMHQQLYMNILSNGADFGMITPTVGMKWGFVEPVQNQFTFSEGNGVAQVAAANKQGLRCHTLLWHRELPQWIYGSFDKAAMTAIVQNHIAKVVQQYKGQCYSWDVVNEAFNDDGTYRDSVFLRTMGEDYIPIAFKAAASADPATKLYYNDYSIESMKNNGAKIEAIKRMIDMIRAKGGRIDGIGMQAHLDSDTEVITVDATVQAMNAFTSKNVDVAITELDVAIDIPTTADSIQRQENQYTNVVTACRKVGRCVGVSIWEFADIDSWIPSAYPNEGSALPWDWNMVKKQGVYDSILRGWVDDGGYCSPRDWNE